MVLASVSSCGLVLTRLDSCHTVCHLTKMSNCRRFFQTVYTTINWRTFSVKRKSAKNTASHLSIYTFWNQDKVNPIWTIQFQRQWYLSRFRSLSTDRRTNGQCSVHGRLQEKSLLLSRLRLQFSGLLRWWTIISLSAFTTKITKLISMWTVTER